MGVKSLTKIDTGAMDDGRMLNSFGGIVGDGRCLLQKSSFCSFVVSKISYCL